MQDRERDVLSLWGSRASVGESCQHKVGSRIERFPWPSLIKEKGFCRSCGEMLWIRLWYKPRERAGRSLRVISDDQTAPLPVAVHDRSSRFT